MSVTKDSMSQIGVKEVLTSVQINETVPSFNQRQLNVPPLTLGLGIYKLVFHFEVKKNHL